MGIPCRFRLPRFVLPAALLVLAVAALCPQGADAQEEETAPGSDWLTFSGNPAHTGFTTLPGPPEEIEMKWRWRINAGASPISASPAITAAGIAYIATEGGYVAAVRPEGGAGWSYSVTDLVTGSPAVQSDGSVFIVTADGYAHYFDASGELLWKSELHVDVDTSPVISGQTAYIGTDDKTLLALNLTPEFSGYEPESRKVLRSEVEQWSFATPGTVKSSPAFAGNTVYFGGGPYLYALNPTVADSDNGSAPVKWRYDINADIHSSPAVYNSRVYIGADDGYLYAFEADLAEGVAQEYLWKRKTGGAIHTSPAVYDPDDDAAVIYVGSDDGRLYAFDENGELQWTFNALGRIRSSPAVDGDGHVYFGADDGAIYALFADGSLKWRYATLGPVRSSPAIGPEQRLYVGSNDGYLYCIGESTREAREPDLSIDLQLTLAAVENNGNPTEVSVTVTSEEEGADVLSRISEVTLDLTPLNLFGLLSSDNTSEPVPVTRVVMVDDGLYEDDVAGDGVFTYVFGITTVTVGYEDGIFFHMPQGALNVGPVPLMVTVTDLYGNTVSKPFALNIVQKDVGAPSGGAAQIVVTNGLSRQDLNLSFTSGTPSILEVTPGSGPPGQRVSIAVVGKNTNFTKNRTRVEIFNDQNVRIAGALPENDDVEVLSDTTLQAVLNIVNSEQVSAGDLTGRWDVVVTTDLLSGGEEVVVGERLFEISASAALTVLSAAPFRTAALTAAQDEGCVFTLDATNEFGARPRGAPWNINVGYSRTVTIEGAESGSWDLRVSINACEDVPSFKIVTSGGNFGFLTGEVRNGLTGQGIDNATIRALVGDDPSGEYNTTRTSGGGYYLLPLAASDESYTVIAHKYGLVDRERDITISADTETQLNFSLVPDLNCPVTLLAGQTGAAAFYDLRDRVLPSLPGGLHLVDCYYRHAPALMQVLADCPDLARQCRRLLRDIAAVLCRAGHWDDQMRDFRPGLQEVIEALITETTGELHQALVRERDAILAAADVFCNR